MIDSGTARRCGTRLNGTATRPRHRRRRLERASKTIERCTRSSAAGSRSTKQVAERPSHGRELVPHRRSIHRSPTRVGEIRHELGRGVGVRVDIIEVDSIASSVVHRLHGLSRKIECAARLIPGPSVRVMTSGSNCGDVGGPHADLDLDDDVVPARHSSTTVDGDDVVDQRRAALRNVARRRACGTRWTDAADATPSNRRTLRTVWKRRFSSGASPALAHPEVAAGCGLGLGLIEREHAVELAGGEDLVAEEGQGRRQIPPFQPAARCVQSSRAVGLPRGSTRGDDSRFVARRKCRSPQERADVAAIRTIAIGRLTPPANRSPRTARRGRAGQPHAASERIATATSSSPSPLWRHVTAQRRGAAGSNTQGPSVFSSRRIRYNPRSVATARSSCWVEATPRRGRPALALVAPPRERHGRCRVPRRAAVRADVHARRPTVVAVGDHRYVTGSAPERARSW